jgi:16S rRNA (cytidine1402-2'-O)-methyltransferase
MTGILYIVATPIGNLEDITLRALRVLKEVDLILAEDTRITKRLLNHYDIDTPTLSYHQHSGINKKMRIASDIIAGKNIALVTDAGTPGISDPGNELISFLVEKVPNIKVVPIPGPSAITASLSVCGLNINKFVFLGFLPKKKRSKLFKWIKEGRIAFAFYESPKRILKTLDVLEDQFGTNTRVFIARELTKIHETVYRGTIREVKEKLKEENIKGEMVVVVEL